MALLAWKLDGRGRVVDEVVILSSGAVGGSSGVYRRLRGEEIVNTKHNNVYGALAQCNVLCSGREFIRG